MPAAENGRRMTKPHITKVMHSCAAVAKFRQQTAVGRDRKFAIMSSTLGQHREHAFNAAVEAATGDVEERAHLGGTTAMLQRMRAWCGGQKKRWGTITVSFGSTRSVILTLISTSLPSTIR